jgi:hypothetical protein
MSFMYLAFYKPKKVYVSLKYTDLRISPDIEFIEELTVCPIVLCEIQISMS